MTRIRTIEDYNKSDTNNMINCFKSKSADLLTKFSDSQMDTYSDFLQTGFCCGQLFGLGIFVNNSNPDPRPSLMRIRIFCWYSPPRKEMNHCYYLLAYCIQLYFYSIVHNLFLQYNMETIQRYTVQIFSASHHLKNKNKFTV